MSASLCVCVCVYVCTTLNLITFQVLPVEVKTVISCKRNKNCDVRW